MHPQLANAGMNKEMAGGVIPRDSPCVSVKDCY